jgi:hypothetical protein
VRYTASILERLYNGVSSISVTDIKEIPTFPEGSQILENIPGMIQFQTKHEKWAKV